MYFDWEPEWKPMSDPLPSDEVRRLRELADTVDALRAENERLRVDNHALRKRLHGQRATAQEEE